MSYNSFKSILSSKLNILSINSSFPFVIINSKNSPISPFLLLFFDGNI